MMVTQTAEMDVLPTDRLLKQVGSALEEAAHPLILALNDPLVCTKTTLQILNLEFHYEETDSKQALKNEMTVIPQMEMDATATVHPLKLAGCVF